MEITTVNWRDALCDIFADPNVSYLTKLLINESLEREPVEALVATEIAYTLMSCRCNEMSREDTIRLDRVAGAYRISAGRLVKI